MGTNKIHLYQFLIARSQGQNIDFKDFEKIQDPQTYDLAKKVFDRYEELMIAHYRTEVREVEGASDTLNLKGMTDNDTVQAVRDLTDGNGVDCVLEVAGVPSLIPTGLKCLRTGGRYVEIGNSAPGAEFTYDACDIVWRRLTLQGIHNYDAWHLQMAVDFLSMTRDAFPFKDLVTHRVSLGDINDGLRIADFGEAIRVAVLP